MPIMRNKRHTTRKQPRAGASVARFDARTIISDIVEWGGVIRFTAARCLMIDKLADLPLPLQRLFLDYPRPSELVAAAREVAGCS